jgi:hypothetical protein
VDLVSPEPEGTDRGIQDGLAVAGAPGMHDHLDDHHVVEFPAPPDVRAGDLKDASVFSDISDGFHCFAKTSGKGLTDGEGRLH